MREFLKVWSYLVNPLFIPLIASLYYFFSVSYSNYEVITIKIYLIAILTVLVPLLIYFFLKIVGATSSIHLPIVKERVTPLAAYAVLILILVRNGFSNGSHLPLYYFFLAVMLSTFTALLLAVFKYKVSLHLLSMGGLMGFGLMLNASFGNPSAVVIAILAIVTGLTATSRLSMKAHVGHELIFGFFLGLIPQITIGSYFL